MRWGEQVSVLDSSNIDMTVSNIEAYVHGKGWFRAQVSYVTALKNKKANITYTVKEGPRYYFDTLFYQVPDQDSS